LGREERVMNQEISWKEFKDSGTLWFVNRMLHLFGMVIILFIDEDTGNVIRAYPARTKFRGFSEECEEKGFIAVSEYLEKTASTLSKEAKEE
jgi:hypothetical protein